MFIEIHHLFIFIKLFLSTIFVFYATEVGKIKQKGNRYFSSNFNYDNTNYRSQCFLF